MNTGVIQIPQRSLRCRTEIPVGRVRSAPEKRPPSESGELDGNQKKTAVQRAQTLPRRSHFQSQETCSRVSVSQSHTTTRAPVCPFRP
ncbi:hypothetical protein RESH_05679 [Rhodopirellula europaea SH398]|uniref:Uncharacterized protein n=1 Tax=Rhodopirellula europaea SH398 TaxID=1263868 RepID=M5RWX1_9BACT|nr:hypothetical protein RESH_05679 [Rhodopirellula europaea SH398]